MSFLCQIPVSGNRVFYGLFVGSICLSSNIGTRFLQGRVYSDKLAGVPCDLDMAGVGSSCRLGLKPLCSRPIQYFTIGDNIPSVNSAQIPAVIRLFGKYEYLA